MTEQQLQGTQYLQAATTLLQRMAARQATAGLLAAADLQWWWRTPRRTDSLPQLFWFDDAGLPEAAAIATDWGDGVALDLVVMPDAAPEQLELVVARALAHVRALGLAEVDIVADRADQVMLDLLARHGYAMAGEGKLDVALAMLDLTQRPPVSPLQAGYRLRARSETPQRPHHMVPRSGPGLEQRLAQASLYRPELDLFVLDPDDDVAAYGLFWFDPANRAGLVEPMRTEAGHQRRGLARHVLTAGIERLAQTGARHVKVCFQPGNTAARDLYLGTGFRPYKRSAVLTRQPGADAGPPQSPTAP